MCGILGVASKRAIDLERVFLAILELEKRGLDGFGVYIVRESKTAKIKRSLRPSSCKGEISEFLIREFKAPCFLIAATRAQPMSEPLSSEEKLQPFEKDGFILAHNGLLSNDKELAEKYGIDSKGKVDTEIVLELSTKIGFINCLDEIIGGFSFIFYDKGRNKLFIAKNYKTLRYAVTEDFVAFASEDSILQKLCEHVLHFPDDSCWSVDLDLKITSEKSIKRKTLSSLPPMDENRAIAVVSGGLDSSTAAFVAKKLHKKDVIILHFNYGQRAQRMELEATKKIAEALNAPLIVHDLTFLSELGKCPLTDKNIKLPLGTDSYETTKCWTPTRNLLMLSIAATYAEALGCGYIYYGNNMEEEGLYPDNDLEFVYHLNQTLKHGTLNGVEVVRALGRLMKPEILLLADYLGVPVDYVWSCDEDSDDLLKPCGVCGCCWGRRHYFLRAGLEDKKQYRNELESWADWTKEEFKPLKETVTIDEIIRKTQ